MLPSACITRKLAQSAGGSYFDEPRLRLLDELRDEVDTFDVDAELAEELGPMTRPSARVDDAAGQAAGPARDELSIRFTHRLDRAQQGHVLINSRRVSQPDTAIGH